MHNSSKAVRAKRLSTCRSTALRKAGLDVVELLEPRRLLAATGTWSRVTTNAPSGAQMGVVLTNGTILIHGGSGGTSSSWYTLTPSSTGSYTSGTYTSVASSNTARLYTATEVLQSGKVLVVGGEYASVGSTSESFTNTGEIYDPVANTWTNITNFPNSSFGDDPSELLPNGTVLAGYISGPQTYIYNPTTNAWAATGTKVSTNSNDTDQSDEEGWVTLPNENILSYSVFSSIKTGTPQAQIYNVSTGKWSLTGLLPAQLSAASVGYEMGPGMLLPDGRVFYAGGTNATAFYTPSTNTWAAGPNMPNGYCMSDAPGAVLPNGDVLLAMSPQGGLSGGSYNFPSPTYVYEFNPTTNIYTNVTPVVSGFSTGSPSYVYTFLVLPTGQVAMMGDQSTIAVYTEGGTAVSSAVPSINGITYAGSTGVYTLSGTNLNGINEGATYGDDNEMSSNYPLIRLTDSSGNVTYARSTNWSLTGVVQGAETVTFTLPTADTTGAYLVQSVANGVPSATALAVLVNANTTTNVSVVTAANTSLVDVDAGTTVKAAFAVSSFSSIYIAGDNSGDTITVNLNSSNANITTYLQGGTGTDTIDVNQTSSNGPVVIEPSAGSDNVYVGTAGAGTAIAQFLASQQLGTLVLGTGGSATVTSNATKTLLQMNAIAISGTGVLDLTNNDMIIHGGNLGALTSLISSGFNGTGGSHWNGPGIISSAAGANTTHLTALGVIQNSANGNAIYASFDGQAVSTTDVLIKYTYYGDANLSGKVDGSDYSDIDNGFLTHATGWVNGDFNYDNVVDGSDYTLIDNVFNTQGATIAAGVAALIATPQKSTVHVFAATSTRQIPAAPVFGSTFWTDPSQASLFFSDQPVGTDSFSKLTV